MKKTLKYILMLLTAGMLVSCGDTGSIKAEFSMKAVVESIGEKIEVTVYEAEYAEGIYWIIYDDSTVFVNKSENKISISEINVGDKIEIFYNGQVMMSYPPQVYAIGIKKL